VRIRPFCLVAALLPLYAQVPAQAQAAPAPAAEPDRTSIYREQLSPPEKEMIEALTCKASHAGSIAETRLDWARGAWDVFVACEPHDSVQGHTVRETASCRGVDQDWKCDATGVEIDLPPGKWEHPLHVGHTTPERGLEVYHFLEQQALKDKELGPDELAGNASIVWIEDNNNYWVRFTFKDWIFSYQVRERCGKRGCQRRLKYQGAYQNLDM
jgi:hypothetical protein